MKLDARCVLTLGRLHLDVAFRAEADEVVAIIGPNGAGKTTLLRALAGLVRLEAGQVRLEDEVLEDVAARVWVPPERRRIGFVFQDLLLFPHLSVIDNVAFGVQSANDRPARGQALAWLERVGMAQNINTKPAGLSGGQAQRVALARALVRNPELLLLDEPLSAIDPLGREALRHELRRHLESFRGVRVIVTHDAADAVALADRVLVLENGVIAADGPPRRVLERRAALAGS